MGERELDRTIDAAAEQMMAREPSRSLGYAVMARVRDGGDTSPAPRRLMWITATACVVAGPVMAIAIGMMSRTPVAVLPPLPVPQKVAVVRPPVIAEPPPAMAPHTARTRRAVPASIVTNVAASLPPSDASPIEAIEMEPISLSALSVPELKLETTSIEIIEIEPLTIEPLTVSND